MSISCRDILSWMESWAPLSYAESWDNVGLQIGNQDKPIKRIMIALNPSQTVVQQAIKHKVDLLITHHPLIFKPIGQVVTHQPLGSIITQLIKHDINVYCAHTNLDIAVGGVNDILAETLQLKQIEILEETQENKHYKLVIYVPSGYEASVGQAICEAGAGCIGDYSHCTFQAAGTGTFLPHSDTQPFLGQVNQLSSVQEYRLETIVPATVLHRVLKAMKDAHPYEEVAYDLFKLENDGEKVGLGRVGELEDEITLQALLASVAQRLNQPSLKYTGPLNQMVKRIAVCGGSGASLIKAAKLAQADVLITGDIKHHDGQLATELGIAIIDAGHFSTEYLVCQGLAHRLKDAFDLQDSDVMLCEDEKDFIQHYHV